MRLQVIGEAAKHITAATAAALPKVPFTDMSGMRNRIAHDYGSVNFQIVWTVAKDELGPLVAELERYLRQHERQHILAQRIREAHHLTIKPSHPKQGPKMGL